MTFHRLDSEAIINNLKWNVWLLEYGGWIEGWWKEDEGAVQGFVVLMIDCTLVLSPKQI